MHNEAMNIKQEAKYFGGDDEIELITIDLSEEIPPKDWEKWLSHYGDVEKMECIGKNPFRPVYQFVYGRCPLCHEIMRKCGTSYSSEGIIVAFCCGSHKEGAKHRFVWSKGFAFPIEGANIAYLGAILKK